MIFKKAKFINGGKQRCMLQMKLRKLNDLDLKYERPIMHEDCVNAIIWINEKKNSMKLLI